MLFNNGRIQIAKVWNVPIYLDWTLLIMAAMFVFRAGSVFVGLISAVVLLVSILLHELGHTAVALSYGCRVRDITLLLLGGRASLVTTPRQPMKEALMAAAGPLVSLALWFLGRGLIRFGIVRFGSVAGYVCSYLAFVNIWLFFFNLVPAFPMDGGRIFRALLASRLGRRRATFIAYRVAQVLAIGMAIWAVVGGFDLVLMLIAYFVFTSARAEYAAVCAEGGFGGGYDPRNDDSVIISPPPYGHHDDVADIYKER